MNSIKNLAIAAVTFLAASSSAFAATDTWTATSSGAWSGAGNWSAGAPSTTVTNTLTFASTSGGPITANNDLTFTGTVTSLNFGAGAASFVLSGNSINLSTSVADSATSAQSITLAQALKGTTNYSVVSGGTLTDTGAISGGAALTKSGLGTLVLGAANTYTGTTTVTGGGALNLDFTQAGAPTSNIISSSSTLTMGGSLGGTLNVIGKAGANNTQTFAGLTIGQGPNAIVYTPGAGGTTAVTITNAISTPSTVSHGYIMFGTGGTTTLQGNLNVAQFTSGGALYALYGIDDFAATNGSGVVGAATYTNYTSGALSGTLLNVTASGAISAGASTGGAGLRFSNSSGTAITFSGSSFFEDAILVTSNAGTSTLTGGNIRNNTGAADVNVFQNSVNAFTIGSTLNNNGGGKAMTLDKYGVGTLVLTGANGYSGGTYIQGGVLQVGNGGSTGVLGTGGVVDNASLVYDVSSALTDANVISGIGTVGQIGTGTVTLTGSNTYTGATSVSSGVLSLANAVAGTSLNGTSITTSGTGAVTQNTTSAIFGTGSSFTQGSTATSTLAAGNAYTGGTFINAGTLNINGNFAIGGSVNGGVTFNGGTLQYAAGSTGNGLLDITQLGAQTVTFSSGGATIDTNGNAVSYANTVGNGGTGNLTVKDSNGTPGSLTLSNATGNNYSGTTTIGSGGSLFLSNSSNSATGSGPVVINGTFGSGGSTNVGSVSGLVTVANGGSIGAGFNGKLATGVLTVGSLTMSVGSTEDVFVNTGNAASLIAVSTAGGLTLTGGVVDPFDAGTSTLAHTLGTYNVIQYAGTFSGTGGLTTVAAPSGLTYTLSNNGAGDIVLTIALASVPNIWNATNGGDWNTTANWSNGTAAGGPNAAGAAVQLTGGTTNVSNGGNVNISSSVTAGSLLFNNASSYTISASAGQSLTLNNSGATGSITLTSGNHTISAPVILASGLSTTIGSTETLTMSGNISGSGTLTVNGPGTTLLSGSNSYGPAAGTVGTVLASGLLQVGSNSALSTGDVSVTGNNTIQSVAPGLSLGNNVVITNGVTATLGTNGNTLTWTGNITDNSGAGGGTGSLTVASATPGGTLILTGTNSIGGTTTINSGATLQIGNGGSNGSVGTAAITDNGTLNNALGAGTNAALGQIISGTGGVTQSGGGTLTLNNSNTYSGTTTISNGSVVAGTQFAMQNSTVNQNGGSLQFGTSTVLATIGDLVGSGTLTLNTNGTASAVSLTMGGNNDANDTFSGNITGKGQITKVGTGTLNLSGSNSYLAGTSVNGGVLNITGSLDTAVTPGAISLTGGTLNVTNASVNASSISVNNASLSAFNMTNSAVTITGALNVNTDNHDNNSLATLTSGTLTAGSISTGRGGTNLGSTPLATGTNVFGVYVNGATVNISGAVGIGNLSGASSGANMMVNAGTVTVGGVTTVSIGSTGGRLSLLDVNGGTYNENDTTTGIQLGGNGSTGAIDAELLVSGTGTLNTAKITMNGNTTAGQGANDTFWADGGTTYIGSGGIVQGATGSVTSAVIDFGASTVTTAPIIGASADWSTSLGITLANSSTGTATTIQTADASNVAHNITLSGVIGGSGGLTKTGTGTLFLTNAANSYSGITTLNQGTTQISTATDLGSRSAATTFNGGTLRYATGSTATDITSSVVGGTVSILAGGATIDINGNSVDYGHSIGNGGTGGLTLADSVGTGTLELDGINTYTGTTTINAGTMEIVEGTGAALTASSGVNLAGSGATFDISNGTSQTINDLSGVAGSTVNVGFNTLTVGTANSTTFAGTITDIGEGGSLYKQGTGTLALTGTSTYSGGTTVANGKLRMNGSVASSVVTVGNNTAASSILSGTGTVGGLVTSTTGSNVAYIAPGSNTSGTRGDFGAAGTLNVGTLGFTIGAGTQFDYDLSTANTVGGGINDLITMSGGTLSIGGSGIVFNLNALSSLSTGVEYTLINGAGSISGFSASDFSATGIGSNTAVFSTTGGALQVELLAPAGPDYYYNGSTSTDFTNFANYSQTISGTPQTSPLSSTSNVFISANSPSNNAPVVNSNVTINTLTFNSNGAGATISGTGTVTLAASGGVGITDAAGSSTGTETISAGVALGSNQAWATTANSTLRVSGSISGPQSLALTGAGTYRLSGSNTFSGLTVGTGSDTPTVYLANGTNGSATGTTTFTVNAGATIGGKGTSSGTSFSIAGTGTATGARANILVGQTSLTDTNTTGVLTLTASGASTIQNAKLTFNLNATQAGSYNSDPSGSGTELAVGSTAISFGATQGSVQLALNLQNEPAIVGAYTPYVLIAGTLNTGGTGVNGSQYSGLTLGTTLVNSGGVTETIITGNNLQLAFGSAIDQTYYGTNSYLVLYQASGVDDIDVVVVPEPGTWAMMLGGLAVLIFWQRRRRQGSKN